MINLKNVDVPTVVLSIAILFLVVALSQCDLNGDTVSITMRIAEVQDTDRGTYTLLRSDDGKVDRMYGDWGSEGDSINGFWTSGAFDKMYNGFHFNN